MHRHAPRRPLKSTAGQTSAEYMGVLLIAAVIVGSLFGSDLSDRVVTETERAICRIASGGEPCDARANPQEEGANAEAAGEPDRQVHDAECDNDLPGVLRRGEGDDPSGDPEADAVYDNLGVVYDYYAETFGRDSYDDAGAELVASSTSATRLGPRPRTPTGTGPRSSSARATATRST